MPHTSRKKTRSLRVQMYTQIPTVAETFVEFHEHNLLAASEGEFVYATGIKVI